MKAGIKRLPKEVGSLVLGKVGTGSESANARQGSILHHEPLDNDWKIYYGYVLEGCQLGTTVPTREPL